MNIQNSKIEDINQIFELYKMSTDFQKSKGVVHWPDFDRELVQKEIRENRQWKIIIDNRIACIWTTTDKDPQIWQQRNEDPSIYIHRISTNPDFKGRNLVREIIAWAKSYARQNNKEYVRMDTVGENNGLIHHYKKCGFDYLGLSTLKNTTGLPLHYNNATVSLFQLTV
ncbi:N-acetyltransferase [Aquimarina sp. RZ0]|uniref:GNAT family N-acetyltransferase n=1 Tax=Aquimarina sp. RZ0 TaxID=2607730 RepID=UPI0011F358D3|nr:GNAT family N-acetyltransferase [Aquimarina sp. RZ0]KAA1248092.1 GNAT family N-acetyltransferase [Aquimarina sp. RZ0]